MKIVLVVLLSLCLLAPAVDAFCRIATTLRHPISLRSLDSDVIGKLENIRIKYESLSGLDTEEAKDEKSKIEDIVEKYTTYREVRIMMGKLRSMMQSEVSEKRKAKQLKSFTDLFKGRLLIEELLKEKLGLPFSKTIPTIPELEEVEKIDSKISELQSELEKVKIVFPAGSTTRDARFSF